jgi:hypothetical protein
MIQLTDDLFLARWSVVSTYCMICKGNQMLHVSDIPEIDQGFKIAKEKGLITRIPVGTLLSCSYLTPLGKALLTLTQ